MEDMIKELTRRVEKLEDKQDEQTERIFKNREELKDTIVEAVREGNKGLIEKYNNHENRLQKLENLDGERAKLIIKSILATTGGWVLMGLLNNIGMFFNK